MYLYVLDVLNILYVLDVLGVCMCMYVCMYVCMYGVESYGIVWYRIQSNLILSNPA